MAENPPNSPDPTPAPVAVKEIPVTATPTPTPSPAPTPAPATVAPWPENWRASVLGELPATADEKQREAYTKEKTRLERMMDPGAIWKSFRELEGKVSSGALKSTQPDPFPADGTDEQKAEWRKANNLPATPADYLKVMKLAPDVRIAEADKPMIDKYLSNMHGKNITPESASAALETYYQIKAETENARLQLDETQKMKLEDTLRAEWLGPEFRQNHAYVSNFISQFPQSVQDGMKNARMPDGTALFNSPDVVRTMARLSRELNPQITTLPNGANGPKAIDARIAEINNVMRTDRQRYNNDQAMQAEYRDLLRAQENAKSRAA